MATSATSKPGSLGKAGTSPKAKPKRIARSLPALDRRRLLAQPSHVYPTGIRNAALMAIMLYGALRCQEALDLRPRDILFDQYLLHVDKGKGKKSRRVVIAPALDPFLLDWRRIRPPGPTFFTTLGGNPLDSRYVRRMVARYGRKAGIEGDVHPHLLRHTCATAWLNEDRLNVREVQVMLGHARLETTEGYLHASLPEIVLKLRGEMGS